MSTGSVNYWTFSDPFGGGLVHSGTSQFQGMLNKIKQDPTAVSSALKQKLVEAGFLPDSVLGAPQAPAAPAYTAPQLTIPGIGGASGAGVGGGGGDASATFAAAAAAADPFASQRGQYQNMLADLMKGNFAPTDPSYQFRLNQGQQALERSAAAKGLLGSGNILQELQKYGQDMASQEYQNQFNRLLPLTGATIGSSGTAGSILAQQPQYGLDVYKTGMQATKLPYELQALAQSGQSNALQQNILQNQYDEMLRQQRLSKQGPVVPIQQQGFLG